MAALDGLTRLLNRQTFESRVSDVWREATARHLPISVLMIDVDDFKRYNDHYGHLAGDECLQRIAEAVCTGVAGNPADLLARYGGEELIAVLIDRTAADAEAAAQRIVADVAALAIPHAGSSTGGAVSISVGVATHHPAAAASYQIVAKAADNALYAAKHQGRNRCVCVKMHVPTRRPPPPWFPAVPTKSFRKSAKANSLRNDFDETVPHAGGLSCPAHESRNRFAGISSPAMSRCSRACPS